MSIDRAAQARKISIEYAKLAKRPLQIWPGDEDKITIEDLPMVSSEWKDKNYGAKTFTRAEFANYSAKLLRPGLKYGIISHEFIYGVGLEYLIGVWS